MKVLYVADVVGGAAKIHVEETCRHLAKLGEKVELVINSPVEIEGVKVVQVRDVKIKRGSALKILVQDTLMLFNSVFRKCDVIYTRNGFLALQMKIFRPFKPVVWEINGISRLEYAQSGQSKAKTALAAFFEERLIPFFTSKIVAVTGGMREMLVKYGVPKSKLAVVPNGVDCEKFNPNIDGSAVREKFGIADNEKLLIFVGKLAAWHGADHMLAIFDTVAQKMKNVKLVLVGISDADLEKFAPSLSAEAHSRIICAGWVDGGKIPEYIAAADAGIHLGIHDYELNPFKVLEYMACGRPVIGTKRGLSE
ncbi:MAG: glycosyltransferase family 4 protein, partial [Candidatus Thermoplasmatota archaeon]|nr:glycosyltransferase family 4 protein [Candidatus Thermoplasmatota archaeon]